MTKPTLVVLTTHFGKNFSGGSTATCEIFSRLQAQFKRIIVIGTRLGIHDFKHLEFQGYRHFRHARQLLKAIDPANTVFYGDFFNAHLFTQCNIPFYFTYHDNWPELSRLSLKYKLHGFYYWRAYRRIFNQAQHVFTVSELKRQQVKNYTHCVSLVRNGMLQRPALKDTENSNRNAARQNVLMVGNIDDRKYCKAIALFKLLPADPGFLIDIHGHINDNSLASTLSQFSFVRMKGYTETIAYSRYRLLLHTSVMENLSIVWCEAILHHTPVLSFDAGAAREVITANRGVCIPCYQVETMRDSLLKMYSIPPKALGKNRKNDIPAFQAEFNWDTAARRYAQIMFESCLQR